MLVSQPFFASRQCRFRSLHTSIVVNETTVPEKASTWLAADSRGLELYSPGKRAVFDAVCACKRSVAWAANS